MFLEADSTKFKYKIIRIVPESGFEATRLREIESLLIDRWSILTQTVLPSETIIYILVSNK